MTQSAMRSKKSKSGQSKRGAENLRKEKKHKKSHGGVQAAHGNGRVRKQRIMPTSNSHFRVGVHARCNSSSCSPSMSISTAHSSCIRSRMSFASMMRRFMTTDTRGDKTHVQLRATHTYTKINVNKNTSHVAHNTHTAPPWLYKHMSHLSCCGKKTMEKNR